MHAPKTLPIPASIVASSLEQACELLGSFEPWTYLLCSSSSLKDAHRATAGWNGIKVEIAPDGALPGDSWLLVGPNGVVWSGRV